MDQALGAAVGRIDSLQAELASVKAEVATSKQNTDYNRHKNSLVIDGKKLYVEPIKDGKGFVKWSESFLRWVKCENPKLKELYEHAGKAKHPINISECPAEW